MWTITLVGKKLGIMTYCNNLYTAPLPHQKYIEFFHGNKSVLIRYNPFSLFGAGILFNYVELWLLYNSRSYRIVYGFLLCNFLFGLIIDFSNFWATQLCPSRKKKHTWDQLKELNPSPSLVLSSNSHLCCF